MEFVACCEDGELGRKRELSRKASLASVVLHVVWDRSFMVGCLVVNIIA